MYNYEYDKIMDKRQCIVLYLLLFFSVLVLAQENNENYEYNDMIEENDTINNDKLILGPIFSFSGFNQFRMGLGLFLGKLGTAGHHPIGYDYGIIFEYNFKQNLMYTRLYGHLTGGASAMLLGGSTVMVFNNQNIIIGFAPEIGIGLSTLFKMFYRYNFYFNSDYNSYEIVLHLCLALNRKN